MKISNSIYYFINMCEITIVLVTTYDDRLDYFFKWHNMVWCSLFKRTTLFSFKGCLRLRVKIAVHYVYICLFPFSNHFSSPFPHSLPSLSPCTILFFNLLWSQNGPGWTKLSLKVFFWIFWNFKNIEPKWLSSLERCKKKWQSSLGRFVGKSGHHP